MRIGQGYDIHQLVAGRPLILGGVEIPHDRGALGHSDADALLHAIIDAMLGAACLGDIGTHFSPKKQEFANIDSTILLARTQEMVTNAGFTVQNIDSSIILEAPKLAPHIMPMRQRIADVLALEIGRISIKAKTKEGLDATGQGQAVEAQAVVLLSERHP